MRGFNGPRTVRGQVVLISGEPGIGKSRITQAVQDRLGTEPHTLRYFCSPRRQDALCTQVTSGLERATAYRRDDTDEQRQAKLESRLAQGT
jgi:predicted ATPase